MLESFLRSAPVLFLVIVVWIALSRWWQAEFQREGPMTNCGACDCHCDRHDNNREECEEKRNASSRL